MNIIQIIPGSGGTFYCGNCLRDSKFVEALRSNGHQVIKIPMYLPLFSDEHDLGDTPVFYGAISIYLKQLYPVFRHAPKWFDRLLNSGLMLKFAAKMSGSTNAKGLEDMTVSMLLGEDGKQHEELERMADWIADNCKPDIIHISNALLLGLAHTLKKKLNVPVVCSLQDEDVWVDVMHERFRHKVWQLMAEKGTEVDGFIAVSHYFATRMRNLLHIPEHKLNTIHLGVNPNDYTFEPKDNTTRNIGYISRMCHENGMDILVDAFILLKKQARFSDVKLILTGGSTGADIAYIKENRQKLSVAGLTEMVEIQEEFEGKARQIFFSRVGLISVPVRNGEAFGLYLIEAMASGVPVVQPRLGAFPEIVGISGGGNIYEQNDPETLANALASLLDDPKQLHKLSFQARKGVEMHFDIAGHAREMSALYENVIKNYPHA